jgi:prepilin-type N-terminal cleavage/methylation domain-containing protein
MSGSNNNMITQKQNNRGFTIIEVIVALVIVGVSITMFVRLLGSSAMLRGKINEYDARLEVAVAKAELSFLGLVETGFDLDNNKNIIEGKIEGKDINWRLEEESIDGFSGYERDVYLYTVSVEGVDISSIGLR